MYQNPVLFDPISSRETWLIYRQFADDDTGDLIALEDDAGDPLYDLTLEIMDAVTSFNQTGYAPTPWQFADYNVPIITATLANYITIVDANTIQIRIPKSVIGTLCGPRTYEVYLTIADVDDADDCRQALIGRLPVLYGGRNT